MKTENATPTDGAINEDLLKQLAFNEKMAELGRISAGVVHELNAPLSVIISASQMIMREEEVPDFVREMIARISTEAQRLSRMTRGLLNFSSTADEAGEVDVNLVADFLLEFVGYEASRRGVTVRRRLDYQLPLIRLDGNLLKQIMLNIIMNGLQAMEDQGGGTLTVETGRGDDNGIAITVSDTGPGVSEADMERIFEPYFTTRRSGEGTGLGLYVTRTLVENLGGRIELVNGPGNGAIFRILFFPGIGEPLQAR